MNQIRLLQKISLLIVLSVQMFCVEQAVATPLLLEVERQEWVKNPLGMRRVLAVCLPEQPDDTAKKMKHFYSTIDWAAFDERQLVVVEVRNNRRHIQNINYAENKITRNRIMTGFGDGKIAKIKDITRCDGAFEFVLIGKDRTSKKRWANFMSLEDIYETIDAMPMRQLEMKHNIEKN